MTHTPPWLTVPPLINETTGLTHNPDAAHLPQPASASRRSGSNDILRLDLCILDRLDALEQSLGDVMGRIEWVEQEIRALEDPDMPIPTNSPRRRS